MPAKRSQLTFSESKGHYNFDWRKALRKKQKTWSDWLDMRSRAADWVTCACGNQCAIIPRQGEGQPKDKILRDLGFRFNIEVGTKNVPKALKTLDQIEARSARLIAEIDATAAQKADQKARKKFNLLNQKYAQALKEANQAETKAWSTSQAVYRARRQDKALNPQSA